MRSLCLAFVGLLAIGISGCGAEEDDRGAVVRPAPHISLAEITRLLEERVGATEVQTVAPVAGRVEPEPLSSARMRISGGVEFDLLVFSGPLALRRAWPSVKEIGGLGYRGGAARAVNVLALFPEGSDRRSFTGVRRLLARLGDACDGRLAPVQAVLHRACFDGGQRLPGPAGEGTDPDEAVPPGTAIELDGLTYMVGVTRQLNPNIRPDRALVAGRKPGEDMTFLGVFLRVCNEAGRVKTPTSRLALLDAFGKRVAPVSVAPDNSFGYAPRPLDEEQCMPARGSAAAQTSPGALVLFEVPVDLLGERPVSLQLTGASGQTRSMRLDL